MYLKVRTIVFHNKVSPNYKYLIAKFDQIEKPRMLDVATDLVSVNTTVTKMYDVLAHACAHKCKHN